MHANLIKGEQKIVAGTLLKTLPKVDKEYKVEFDVKAISLPARSNYYNVIHFTNVNKENLAAGGRTPAMWIHDKKLWIETTMDGAAKNFRGATDVHTNKWIHIEIEQIEVNSKYQFNIRVDGTMMASEVNNKPEVFSNVLVYASNSWHTALSGYIRNLSFYMREPSCK